MRSWQHTTFIPGASLAFEAHLYRYMYFYVLWSLNTCTALNFKSHVFQQSLKLNFLSFLDFNREFPEIESAVHLKTKISCIRWYTTKAKLSCFALPCTYIVIWPFRNYMKDSTLKVKIMSELVKPFFFFKFKFKKFNKNHPFVWKDSFLKWELRELIAK